MEQLSCLFCLQATDDDLRFGPKYTYTFQDTNYCVHYFCLLYACGLSRRSDDDSEGVQGFHPEDIMREVTRGRRLVCSFCRRKGATMGCCISQCRVMYHLPCALANDVTCVACHKFESFCRKHHSRTPIRLEAGTDTECASCLFEVSITSPTDRDVIQCTCCKRVCHQTCVQKFANVAGMTHFKCPFCACNYVDKEGLTEEQLKASKKCKKRYVKAAQARGVYVPVKDADWELDSSFDSHDAEYDTCDILQEDGS